MQTWNYSKVPLLAIAAIALTAASVLAVRAVAASDHQDTPLVEFSPRFDVNDVYAFPAPSNPSRTVLVLGTSSPLTPAQTPSRLRPKEPGVVPDQDRQHRRRPRRSRLPGHVHRPPGKQKVTSRARN